MKPSNRIHDRVRERYYKAKSTPVMGRGMDGEIATLALVEGPDHRVAMSWFIDRGRRNPEDSLSMECCSDTRDLYESDKAFDEQWTPDNRRENRSLLVWPDHINSSQSRDNG